MQLSRNPWIMHANYSSACPHVLLLKGRNWVIKAIESEVFCMTVEEMETTRGCGAAAAAASLELEEHEYDLRAMYCIECLNARVLVVTYPCKHLIMCLQCCVNRKDCPTCQNPVAGYMELGRGPLVRRNTFFDK